MGGGCACAPRPGGCAPGNTRHERARSAVLTEVVARVIAWCRYTPRRASDSAPGRLVRALARKTASAPSASRAGARVARASASATPAAPRSDKCARQCVLRSGERSRHVKDLLTLAATVAAIDEDRLSHARYIDSSEAGTKRAARAFGHRISAQTRRQLFFHVCAIHRVSTNRPQVFHTAALAACDRGVASPVAESPSLTLDVALDYAGRHMRRRDRPSILGMLAAARPAVARADGGAAAALSRVPRRRHRRWPASASGRGSTIGSSSRCRSRPARDRRTCTWCRCRSSASIWRAPNATPTPCAPRTTRRPRRGRFRALSGEVAQRAQQIAVIERSRSCAWRPPSGRVGSLADWPGTHYGYRATEVREIRRRARRSDRRPARVRRQPGASISRLSATTTDAPAIETLLPPPDQTRGRPAVDVGVDGGRFAGGEGVAAAVGRRRFVDRAVGSAARRVCAAPSAPPRSAASPRSSGSSASTRGCERRCWPRPAQHGRARRRARPRAAAARVQRAGPSSGSRRPRDHRRAAGDARCASRRRAPPAAGAGSMAAARRAAARLPADAARRSATLAAVGRRASTTSARWPARRRTGCALLARAPGRGAAQAGAASMPPDGARGGARALPQRLQPGGKRRAAAARRRRGRRRRSRAAGVRAAASGRDHAARTRAGRSRRGHEAANAADLHGRRHA